MSEHPPVPPNMGKFIYEIDGEWCVLDGSAWSPLKFVLRDAHKGLHQARLFLEVKSRCRCAWLDEAVRRFDTCSYGDYKGVDECHANEILWDKWGKS